MIQSTLECFPVVAFHIYDTDLLNMPMSITADSLLTAHISHEKIPNIKM